jgi:hypothetical protein
MPGLNLGGMGSVRATASTGYNNPSSPTTASQAAFGPNYGGGMPSSQNALMPNDPFGVCLWSAVTAAIVLLVIRHSLPA